MITIHYPKSTPLIQDWEEQLTQLVVAFQTISTPTLPEPQLTDEDTVIVGAEDIQRFIDDLKTAIDDWRAPGCGI